MKFSTRDLCFCAIGAALIAVCAWISIPADVPFTLQTFAIFAVCGLLGGRRGTVSVLVYLLLGAVGAPVFAGFRGGFAALIGTTGGYLVGFILLALIIALAQARWGLGQWVFVLSAAVGLLVCYAFGTAWFLIVYTRTGRDHARRSAGQMCAAVSTAGRDQACARNAHPRTAVPPHSRINSIRRKHKNPMAIFAMGFCIVKKEKKEEINKKGVLESKRKLADQITFSSFSLARSASDRPSIPS